MQHKQRFRWRLLRVTVAVSCAGFIWGTVRDHQATEARQTRIVQAQSLDDASAAVRAAGGTVTHELGIINAVGARLTRQQLERLDTTDGSLRIHADRSTAVAGAGPGGRRKAKADREAEKARKKDEEARDDALKDLMKDVKEEGKELEKLEQDRDKEEKEWDKEWGKDAHLRDTKPTYYPDLVNARQLHDEQITGLGVTVAVIDSGVWGDEGLVQGWNGDARILAVYDTIEDELVKKLDSKFDGNGHGTHVASVAVNSRKIGGLFNGIAPDANLVVVKAFDEKGRGSYADVIRGLDWLVRYKDELGIRVVNLSFSAPPRSAYYDDPLNQAVMSAWQAGIVVVASAGNTGPFPMSVGVPGNVPYVITVGAVTDRYTPGDRTDDRLTWFSAAGPTHDGTTGSSSRTWSPRAGTCAGSCRRTVSSQRSTDSFTMVSSTSRCPARHSPRRS